MMLFLVIRNEILLVFPPLLVNRLSAIWVPPLLRIGVFGALGVLFRIFAIVLLLPSPLLPLPKHLFDHAYHLQEQLVDQGIEFASDSFDHAHDLLGEAAEAEDAEEKVDDHGNREAHDTFDGVGGAAEVALDDVGGGFEDLLRTRPNQLLRGFASSSDATILMHSTNSSRS